MDYSVQCSGTLSIFLKEHGEEAKERGVVLAYDVREFQHEPFYSKQLPNPLSDVN